MDLDELRSIQNTERQKDSLQHLRESFYADVAEYVADLERRRNEAAAEVDDPFGDPEVRRLSDEIETAREVTEAIYERRLGKLVKRASLAATDMPADADGLTAEERELFDTLVERIESNKSRVLDVLEDDAAIAPLGEARRGRTAADEQRAAGGDDEGAGQADRADAGRADPTPERADATAKRSDADADRDERDQEADLDGPAAVTGSGEASDDDGDGEADGDDAEPGDPAADGGLSDRTTVRITDDVGEVFGVDDRDYELTADDVVTLPAVNAEPLLDRGAAERID